MDRIRVKTMNTHQGVTPKPLVQVEGGGITTEVLVIVLTTRPTGPQGLKRCTGGRKVKEDNIFIWVMVQPR
jgi:hypothetical protein